VNNSGLIYDSSFSPSRGIIWLDLPSGEGSGSAGPVGDRESTVSHKRSNLLWLRLHGGIKFLSNFLVLASLAGMILTMLPVAAMEAQYAYKSYMSNKTDKAYVLLEEPLPATSPGPANDMEAFGIHINKINAHSVVVPNVDANDPKIYMEALKNGVAHALGSGLPGVESSINRSIYLFAHSTSAPSLVAQYNAQFYLLYKLEVGDEVEIVFWNKSYKYRVTDKKTVAADDTSFLTPQTEKEILILATCTPPGTTWKRLIILAERI